MRHSDSKGTDNITNRQPHQQTIERRFEFYDAAPSRPNNAVNDVARPHEGQKSGNLRKELCQFSRPNINLVKTRYRRSVVGVSAEVDFDRRRAIVRGILQHCD